jgi:hypothetical protein
MNIDLVLEAGLLGYGPLLSLAPDEGRRRVALLLRECRVFNRSAVNTAAT